MAWLEILFVVLAIPIGYLIAWLCRDELVDGRKWFYWVVVLGVIFSGWFFLIGNLVASYTCLFIVIVGFISLMESKNEKLAVKRKV